MANHDGYSMLASLGWAVRWGIPNGRMPPMASPLVHNSGRERTQSSKPEATSSMGTGR